MTKVTVIVTAEPSVFLVDVTTVSYESDLIGTKHSNIFLDKSISL